MARLIIILIFLFLLVLGDIAWFEVSELLWCLHNRFGQKLNWMKKKRPAHIRWRFR